MSHINPVGSAKILIEAPARQGRRYGYLLNSSIVPNNEGKLSAGLDKRPPRAGATIAPVDQQTEIKEKPRDSLVLSVISPVNLVRGA